ncbi:hypothetical protein QA601_08515 [Chitinispirillales bacterium ANBcel5]|nr:hypothetical protein [Chitinispirillales bacterium ANBcel5]
MKRTKFLLRLIRIAQFIAAAILTAIMIRAMRILYTLLSLEGAI